MNVHIYNVKLIDLGIPKVQLSQISLQICSVLGRVA